MCAPYLTLLDPVPLSRLTSVLTSHRDLQMKTTWLSTNTNMRWPWSLAQRGMTVSLLLVRALEVGRFWSNWYFSTSVCTRGFPPLQTKPLHPPAFWRTARRSDSSMNLPARSTMTSKKRLKMTLKRLFLLVNSSSADHLTSAFLSLICSNKVIYSYFSVVTTGFVTSRNTYHTQQNGGTHSYGGASR